MFIIAIILSNKEYKAITIKEFETKMIELNYILNPREAKTEQMENVKELTFAISKDLKTQIEYINFNSKKAAKEFFDNMKIVFKEIEKVDEKEEYKEMNNGDYNKFLNNTSK